MDSELDPDGILKMIEKIETSKLYYFLEKIKLEMKVSDSEGKKYLLSLKRLIENELCSRRNNQEINKLPTTGISPIKRLLKKLRKEINNHNKSERELELIISSVKPAPLVVEEKKEIPKRSWWDRKNFL